MIAILLIGLFIFFAMNIPISFSMILTSVIYLLLKGDIPLIVVAHRVAAGTDKYLLLCIPFFFLAGELMNAAGIMERLVRFSRSLVGHIPGGLGHVNVVSSMLFSGISGSAVSDASGLGMLEIELMRRSGYDDKFSGAITAASATIGPVIPPSIPFVIFGGITGVSIGKLFLGGVIPGLLEVPAGDPEGNHQGILSLPSGADFAGYYPGRNTQWGFYSHRSRCCCSRLCVHSGNDGFEGDSF